MSIPAIASAVSAVQQTQVTNQIATAVAGKQLDAAKLQGEAAVELVEAALQVDKSQETGRLLDLLA